jgi:hypothetical protein
MSAEPATPEKPDHRRYTSLDAEGEAAVGRIAIWAAFVEQSLVDLCASLINDNFEVGYAVTANMSASSMIQLAKKLVSETQSVSPKSKAHTIALLTEAKGALEQRNKILHATVGSSLEKGKTAFYNSRRKKAPAPAGKTPQLEAAFHGPEDLDEIGARLYKVQEDLWDCVFFPHE